MDGLMSSTLGPRSGVLARLDGAPEVRLVWHYLALDQVRVSRRSAEQLEALRERTIGLIDSIQGEQRFEPRPGPLCSWCEYRERCPIFGLYASARAGFGRAAFYRADIISQ